MNFTKEQVNNYIKELLNIGNVYNDIFSNSMFFRLYLYLFNKPPHVEYLEPIEDTTKCIDCEKSLSNIMSYLGEDCYKLTFYDDDIYIYNNVIFKYDNNHKLFTLFVPSREYFNTLSEKCIIYKDSDTKLIGYVTKCQLGFKTVYLDVKKPEVDINLNYNDDFPYDKLVNIVKSEESGIIILFGIPGSGKSFIIRDLIYNTDSKFIFIDSSCFNYITDDSFIELLINNKNCIFVLEDCEDILQDRSSGNQKISSLLNISDGILGDSLNLKFICTFNSDLTKIDPAILRKGRLKLKYEFTKLNESKVKLLAEKLGKDIPPVRLPLCDVYNYDVETGHKQTSKIGF